MPTISRRNLLRTGAALVTTTGFVGTSGAERTNSDQSHPASSTALRQQNTSKVPDYADWIPAPSSTTGGSTITTTHYEMDAIANRTFDLSEESNISDPMLINPITSGAVAPVLEWARLRSIGIAKPIVGSAVSEENVDPADIPTDHGLLIPSSGQKIAPQVYLGSFDKSALKNAANTGELSETATSGIYSFEREDTTMVVTWGKGYVVVAPSEELVSTLVKTGQGKTDRAVDVSSPFSWLLQITGHGDVSLVGASKNEPLVGGSQGANSSGGLSAFKGATGIGQSVTFADAGVPSEATAAVVYPDKNSVNRDQLESNLGTQASDLTVEQNGPKVTFSATYSTDQLSSTSDGTDTEAGPSENESEMESTVDSTTAASPAGAGTTTGFASGDSGTEATTGATETQAADNSAGGDGSDGSDGSDGDDGTDGGDSDSTVADGSTTTGGEGPGMGIFAGFAGIAGSGYLYARRVRGGEEE